MLPTIVVCFLPITSQKGFAPNTLLYLTIGGVPLGFNRMNHIRIDTSTSIWLNGVNKEV